MRVLALAHDLVDDDDARFAELRPAEARMVWELGQADVLREIYFRADFPSAVLLFEVPGVAAAREAVDRLPFVAAGLIEFDLIPLMPYPGFAQLFREA